MKSHEVNREGREKVKAELLRRGAGGATNRGTRKISLQATNSDRSRTVEIRVKAKQRGTWQTSIDEAQTADTPLDPEDVTSFWVFVAFGRATRFWIVPEWWIRNDIHEAHQQWLRKHGGQRPITPESTHHAIAESRLEDWQNRWHILGLF